MKPISTRDRYEGALLGLACGDAIGTTVEFSPRGSFPPVTEMSGGGPFSLLPGQWTDDTSMALCLAESLLAKKGFDAADQMGRYLNWWRWGYLSSTGECFDIGMTTSKALARFVESGDPFSGSTDPNDAGNGSLMRLAPVVLYFYPDKGRVLDFAAASSRTTHGAPEVIDCCRLLAVALIHALSGLPKEQSLSDASAMLTQSKVHAIASGSYASKSESEIRGSGYCVESLEASLWCLARTDSFANAVLAAANLGDDADTTAAIVGQLAGAYYGASSIPHAWVRTLYLSAEIRATAGRLFDAAVGVSS
jgi:ADP-ribosyl-[dinitrogen reductase] hydrolase